MADGTSGGADGSGRPRGGAPLAAALPSQRPRTGRGSGWRTLRSRNRLTGRAGILALTLCAIMVTLAYPLRQYLAQRDQITALQQQNDTTAKQVADLRGELAKWSDPAYVAIQARERLHYVRPGETGFTVPDSSMSAEPLGIPTPKQQAWYDRLWSTVKTPSPGPSPSPSP